MYRFLSGIVARTLSCSYTHICVCMSSAECEDLPAPWTALSPLILKEYWTWLVAYWHHFLKVEFFQRYLCVKICKSVCCSGCIWIAALLMGRRRRESLEKPRLDILSYAIRFPYWVKNTFAFHFKHHLHITRHLQWHLIAAFDLVLTCPAALHCIALSCC